MILNNFDLQDPLPIKNVSNNASRES